MRKRGFLPLVQKFICCAIFLLGIFCPLSLKAQAPSDGVGSLPSGAQFRGAPRPFSAEGQYAPERRRRHWGNGFRRGRQENQGVQRRAGDLLCVDTHNHLVGRRVEGKLMLERSSRIALQSMDSARVQLNFVMPMPQAPNQKLLLVLEDLLPIVERFPKRFAALGGGGTLNVMIQQTSEQESVSPDMEQKFDARAAEIVQKGAVGFGEMAAEHFSMGGEHPYESVSPDHPLFLRLADLAARYGLPIDIHMEAISKQMPIPPRFRHAPNPEVLKPNIEAFGRLLSHNRKARIVWAHLGWDNTGERTVALTRKLLAENSNLYMSIRIASGMRKRKVVSESFPLDSEGRLKPEWLALFEEFPDRFLIGSDEIVKPANDHPSAESIQSTVDILELLPEELKRQIGHENACRVYKLDRV